MPNEHQIENIPGNVVVEVPAWVGKSGIQGIRLDTMPANIMAQILFPRLAIAERHIEFARAPHKGLMMDVILHEHVKMALKYPYRIGSFEEAQNLMHTLLEEDRELAALVEDRYWASYAQVNERFL